jgi:hypothetical protein
LVARCADLSRDNGLSRSWFRKLAQIVGSAAL